MPRKVTRKPLSPPVRDKETSITKEATVKAFLKAHTSQRISVEAIPAMVAGMNELALSLAQKAEALSQAEQRTTILGRDMDEALKSVGSVENTPENLFKAIEKLEPEMIGQVALKIAAWVKEHRQALGMG